MAQWAADHIDHVRSGGFGPCQAVGVASGYEPHDQLYAVVVFHDWQPGPRTLQFSAAARSPRWATPGVLRAMLHYPFVQLHVHKLWAAIPSDNARALRFNLGIGMRQEANLRHHFGSRRHAVIVGMLREEYLRSRWAPVSERKAA